MKLISFVLIAAIVMTACNDSGWSDAQKQSSMKECMNGMTGNIDEGVAKKICNCAVEKMMKKYASYAEANKKGTTEEGTEIGRQCAQEVMATKKGDDNGGGGGGGLTGTGGWSNDDEQKFMNTCVKNAMNAGADEQTSRSHCDCTLKKIEKKYSSYAEADRTMTKAEVDAIEQECIKERQGNNN